MKHEFSKSQLKGIHAVKSGKERVIIDGIWSIEIPKGYSYCAEYEKTATDINGNHYRLQVQKTDSCDFSTSYGSEVSLTVKDSVIEFNNYTSDARDAKEILMQCASPIGTVELIKEDKNILVAICESFFVSGNYAFYIIAGGRNVMYSGQVTFEDDTGLNEAEIAKSFVKSIEPVLINDLATGTGLVRLSKSYLPNFDTGKYLNVDNSFRVPIPEGYETKYDLNAQIKAAVVPKNAVFTSSGVRCKVGFVMYQDPMNVGMNDTRLVIDSIKKFFIEQTGIDFYNWPITTVRDTSKGTIVYSTITNTPCDQNTNPFLVVTGGKAYHCFIVITYDKPISDECDTKWDADIITTAWLSKILFKGEKKPDKGKDNGDMLEKAFPDKSLYPHYDHLLNAAPNIPGVKVVVNQGGTEYAFYGLKGASDPNSDDFGGEQKILFSRIVDQDSSSYGLDQNAREMAAVFHVDPSIFNMRDDREAELLNGYMKRAYMFSAIRSFGWTLSDFCCKQKKQPADISFKELKGIVEFISERNWLNYDDKTYCKGLCTGSDLHIYFVPDSVSQDDRTKLLPSQEDYDRVSKMRSIAPAYNEILSDVQSLDALREDLTFIYPAIKTLHDELAKKRNNMKPLEGNEADIVYAWCALAMAAKEPFFTEDGPTSYVLSQPEHTETPAVSHIAVKTEIEKGIVTVGDDPVRVAYDNSWTIEIPAGYSYCNDPEINAISAKGSPYKLIISQKFEKEVFTDRLDGTFVIRMLETTTSDENYFNDMLKGKALFDHIMLDDVRYIYPDDSIAISYHEFMGSILFFVVTPEKKYCGQAIFNTRPGKKSEQKLRTVLESVRRLNTDNSKTKQGLRTESKEAKPIKKRETVQNKQTRGQRSFQSADTAKINTKLISNDKGYAVRILSIAEVNKEENLQDLESHFRKCMTVFNPEFHDYMETILPLAQEFSSLFVDGEGNNYLEEGKMVNTSSIHALRSLVWTATNLSDKKVLSEFPSDAPLEMWLELARFIHSKGYVNYKQCKPETKVYGNALFRSKEVNLKYTDRYFKHDENMVKSIQNALDDDLFELVAVLHDISPIMKLYYEQITESEALDSDAVEAMKCILQGWTAFAYACRTPFCVVQKSSYKGNNSINNKPNWTTKYETTEYEGGRFTAIGTSLIDVKGEDEELCIPEGITDIYFDEVYYHEWNPEFAKKVVYPTSFTGTIVVPSKAEEVEILGDFDALEIQAYKPYCTLPRLKRLVCKGTANSLEYGCEVVINKALNLKEVVFPEGIKEIKMRDLCYNNIETVHLPESLQLIEEDNIENPSGSMFGTYPATTFIVYRTCYALDYLQRQFEEEKREINYNNNELFNDKPDLHEQYTFKLKVIEAPWISNAQAFVRGLGVLYGRDSSNGVKAETERIVTITSNTSSNFRMIQKYAYKEAAKQGLNSLASIINNAGSFVGLSDIISDDIVNTIEVKAQKERERKLAEEQMRKEEIAALSQSEKITELEKAVKLIKTYFGEADEEAQLADKCIEKIYRIKADKYAKAIALSEEGNEASISSALELFKEITPFEDSESRIAVCKKLLEDERSYLGALSLISGSDIANLIKVKKVFEKLGSYKDSEIKAAACDRFINELCEKKYQEAKLAENEYSINSQMSAISSYEEIGDYKDALERIAICNSNIAIIEEYLELDEKLEKHKKELEQLTGLFKKRQRQEKEALIKQIEQQLDELSSKLADNSNEN